MIKHCFNEIIFPDKLLYELKMFNIKIIDQKYIIKSFEIHTVNNKVDKLIITNGKHPNCNPETFEFCIPHFFKTLDLNSDTIQLIKNMLKIFNFQNCYFQPWLAFEYL